MTKKVSNPPAPKEENNMAEKSVKKEHEEGSQHEPELIVALERNAAEIVEYLEGKLNTLVPQVKNHVTSKTSQLSKEFEKVDKKLDRKLSWAESSRWTPLIVATFGVALFVLGHIVCGISSKW